MAYPDPELLTALAALIASLASLLRALRCGIGGKRVRKPDG